MKEADLYPAVKAWLLAQGCTKVVPEVPLNFSQVDVMGVTESLIYGVEMKRFLSWSLVRQGNALARFCDRAYIAVGSKPTKAKLEDAAKYSFGVLRVVNGAVEVVSPPKLGRDIPPEHYWQQRVRDKVARMSDQGVGGVPCVDGVGPARECKRLVLAYKAEHPKATWEEIYRNVPNHYANAKSMCGALVYSMARRDQWKRDRKELAAQMRAAKVERQA